MSKINAIKVLYGLDIDMQTREAKNGNLYTTLKFNGFDHEKHKKSLDGIFADQKRSTHWQTRTIRVFYNEKTIKFGNSVFQYFKAVKGVKPPPRKSKDRDFRYYSENPDIVKKIKDTPWKTKYKFDKSKFIFKITKKGKLQVIQRLSRPHIDFGTGKKRDTFRDVTKDKGNGYQRGWKPELTDYVTVELRKMAVLINIDYYSPEFKSIELVAKMLVNEIETKVKELEKRHEYAKN